MNNKTKLQVFVFFSAVIVMVIVLAASVSQLEFQPGRTVSIIGLLQSRQTSGVPALGQLPINPMPIIAATLWIGLIASIILLLFSLEARRKVLKRIITYTVLALVIYGFIMAVQAILQPSEMEQGAPLFSIGDMLAPTDPLPSPPEYVNNPPQWLTWTITILLGAIPVTISWFLWNRRVAKKNSPPDDTLEQISLKAKTALDEIEAGGDLKDIIWRCYRQMSTTLADNHNLHRSQAMTPREFEQYLAESGLRIEDIQRLTYLFESVRYGDKSPGSQQEREAVDCLNAIINVYGAPQ